MGWVSLMWAQWFRASSSSLTTPRSSGARSLANTGPQKRVMTSSWNWGSLSDTAMSGRFPSLVEATRIQSSPPSRWAAIRLSTYGARPSAMVSKAMPTCAR